jgi:hypothetical protein
MCKRSAARPKCNSSANVTKYRRCRSSIGERWGDGEMGRWGDGEVGRWGDGEVGRWGDGEVGRWGDWGGLEFG